MQYGGPAMEANTADMDRGSIGPLIVSTNTSRSALANKPQLSDRITLWAAILILAIAPLPLGSNRPPMWIGWGIAVGALSVFYFGMRLTDPRPLPLVLSRIWLEAALLATLVVWLAVQMLPLGGLLGPIVFEAGNGGSVTTETLSLAPGATWLMLVRMLTFALLFALIAQLTVRTSAGHLLLYCQWLIIAGYAVLGLFSLFQGDTILGMEKWAYLGSATATFVNRNSFATFLSFGLVLGVVQMLGEMRSLGAARSKAFVVIFVRSRLPLLVVGTALIGAALLATQSRMGVFAGGVGVLVTLLAAIAHGRPKPGIVVTGIVAAAMVSVFLWSLLAGGLVERLEVVEAAASGRAELYHQVWAMIVSRPWLGFGGGSFELAYPLFHSAPVSFDLTWDKAHSSYLSLWVELGLVGGSLPLLALSLLTWRAARMVVRRQGQGLAAIASLGCLAVAATHSIVDFSLEIEANALFLVATIALVVSSEIRYAGRR